jgi:hypothetical protein
MHMNTIEIAAPAGVANRPFALGTVSFGAFQNGRAHTAR